MRPLADKYTVRTDAYMASAMLENSLLNGDIRYRSALYVLVHHEDSADR